MKRLIQKLGRKLFGRKTESVKPATKEPAAKSNREKAPRPPAASRRKTVTRQEEPSRWTLNDFQVPPKEGFARFHDYELPTPIMHAIHDLGFQYCTPIQAKVLGYARSGRNIAGKAQTGTGKTAAFLICMFSQFLANREGAAKRKPGLPRALVLAPTRELVMQIIDDARHLAKHSGFRCLAVYGGIDYEKQQRELAQRPIDLVAATPGRLLDFMNRRVLDLKDVEVLVIDEADRMLDMGFIPDVRRIIHATPPKDKRQTLLFSATLTEEVMRLASQWMPDPVICEIEAESVTVKNVTQTVYIIRSEEKFRVLYNLLTRQALDRVLIFGNRRDTTERLVDNLRRHGLECEYLSGAVRQEKRQRVLEDFRSGKIRMVVATDVAGRGLHVDNITHVINYDFPYEPEDYVHRIGRTARAGVKGTAVSFACEEESFVIPEIEEYIGQPLTCVVPEQELLEPLPSPARAASVPPPRPPRRMSDSSRSRRPPPRRR